MINDRLVDITINASEAASAAVRILGESGPARAKAPSISLKKDGSAVVTLTIEIQRGALDESQERQT